MKTESIEYKDGDVTLRGFLAYNEAQSGRRPGVLVMPGGFGLGANAKGRAEMLARLALEKLKSLPQVDPGSIAAIGYCLGGTFVLELAREGAPLKGVVTFHGGLETKDPAAPGQVKAKLLILTGADDPTVPAGHVNALAEEMTKAGADWQIVSYSGTKHGFTYPDAATRKVEWIEHNQLTDERSWKAMRSFFEEIF